MENSMGSVVSESLMNTKKLRDKTMAYKLMYIPNDVTKIIPSVDYNQWLKRLNTQLDKPTN